MKTYIKYDYYIQLFFLIAGLLSAIIDGSSDFESGGFYIIVGVPQLISFIVRAFQRERKSKLYIFYGIFILPVWLSLLILFGFDNVDEVANFLGVILMLSLFYSPILAIIYVYELYGKYKTLKHTQ